MKNWKFAGSLISGERVYWSPGGDLAVKKDHDRLADPTPEERKDIYKTMPHLKQAIGNHKPLFDVRSCSVRGCTDEDCSGCIARTGRPCHWIEVDLCSACFIDPMNAAVLPGGAS